MDSTVQSPENHKRTEIILMGTLLSVLGADIFLNQFPNINHRVRKEKTGLEVNIRTLGPVSWRYLVSILYKIISVEQYCHYYSSATFIENQKNLTGINIVRIVTKNISSLIILVCLFSRYNANTRGNVYYLFYLLFSLILYLEKNQFIVVHKYIGCVICWINVWWRKGRMIKKDYTSPLHLGYINKYNHNTLHLFNNVVNFSAKLLLEPVYIVTRTHLFEGKWLL